MQRTVAMTWSAMDRFSWSGTWRARMASNFSATASVAWNSDTAQSGSGSICHAGQYVLIGPTFRHARSRKHARALDIVRGTDDDDRFHLRMDSLMIIFACSGSWDGETMFVCSASQRRYCAAPDPSLPSRRAKVCQTPPAGCPRAAQPEASPAR